MADAAASAAAAAPKPAAELSLTLPVARAVDELLMRLTRTGIIVEVEEMAALVEIRRQFKTFLAKCIETPK